MEYVTTHPEHKQQAALAALVLGLQTRQHNASTYWRRSGHWLLHLREGPYSKLLKRQLHTTKTKPCELQNMFFCPFHFCGYGHTVSEIFALCYLILVMWENKIWPASGFSPGSPVKSHCNCTLIYSIKLNESYDSIWSKRVILRRLIGELGLRPAPMDVQCFPQVFLGHGLRRQRWPSWEGKISNNYIVTVRDMYL